MIRFHGKPFLEYLVECIRDQGFSRILLLLGYLPNVIVDHFGSGRQFGINIEYSITAVENDTGRRLQLAQSSLDECFLLVYGDNYWPMQFESMWKQYLDNRRLAQITVYNNQDRYSRSNVAVDNQGIVTNYDKTRMSPGLSGVEIGFAFLRRKVCELIPETNANFESTVYPKLVEQKELSGYVTYHRYYSVGSHERLPITESFFARHKTIILDRDGVINEKPDKGEYVCDWRAFRWLPGVFVALRLLNQAGYRSIIVTNQAGISRGMLSETRLAEIHARMRNEVLENGGRIEAIYHCPHGWDEGCECRKPRPGMLFRAQRDFHLDLTKTVFVGDDARDREAGEAAGCHTILLQPGASLLQVVQGDILGSRVSM
jgi:D-glycero-D-manno-heptose 1,7-bisphosphate phosphatase